MTELTLTTSRPATAKEVEDLITGTGAMVYNWWSDWRPKTRNRVDGWLFNHDGPDSEEGAGDVETWVSNQQILDAAGRFLAEGRGGDASDMLKESIGYADASDADVILQYAVLGEAVFG
ncbi:hypothetical protein SEA_SADLAD_83 [Microbacterium phage SadLad]|nr:hypothetical protein SEA_SADLAD_83 [Microbacterium phage SadLad]